MAKGKLKAPQADQGARIKAHASSNETPDAKKPIFCFEHMVNGYCVETVSKDQKAALADALFKRSRMTWGQLKLAHRHGLGYEKIGRGSFKVGIPACVKEDVDLIAFRFMAMAPMVGFRDGQVFRVLWLDHNFSVYDHG